MTSCSQHPGVTSTSSHDCFRDFRLVSEAAHTREAAAGAGLCRARGYQPATATKSLYHRPALARPSTLHEATESVQCFVWEQARALGFARSHKQLGAAVAWGRGRRLRSKFATISNSGPQADAGGCASSACCACKSARQQRPHRCQRQRSVHYTALACSSRRSTARVQLEDPSSVSQAPAAREWLPALGMHTSQHPASGLEALLQHEGGLALQASPSLNLRGPPPAAPAAPGGLQASVLVLTRARGRARWGVLAPHAPALTRALFAASRAGQRS